MSWDKWLDVGETKDRMFTIDDSNIVRYGVRHNKRPILYRDEKIFMEIIYTATGFSGGEYTRHKCKIALLQFEPKTKCWIIDKEVLTLNISKSDFEWFKKMKISNGDRVSLEPYFFTYNNKIKGKALRWTVIGRNRG